MEQKVEEITIKASPIKYDLHLISGGEEIIFWGNDLNIENKLKCEEKYS